MPRKGKITSVEAAYKCLYKTKVPMTPHEIIDMGRKEYGLVMNGKTPASTLNANLITEVKRRRRTNTPQRFVRIKRGYWGLVEFLGEAYEVEPGTRQPGE